MHVRWVGCVFILHETELWISKQHPALPYYNTLSYTMWGVQISKNLLKELTKWKKTTYTLTQQFCHLLALIKAAIMSYPNYSNNLLTEPPTSTVAPLQPILHAATEQSFWNTHQIAPLPSLKSPSGFSSYLGEKLNSFHSLQSTRHLPVFLISIIPLSCTPHFNNSGLLFS